MDGSGRDLNGFSDESRLTLSVRPNDLDALGHVNNAVALEYLEAGRWDWLDRHRVITTDRAVAVVARAEVDYRAEIPRGQVEVRTVLEEPTAAELAAGDLTFRARFRQQIHVSGAPKPAVTALITVAFLDGRGGQLIPMQDYLAAAADEPARPTTPARTEL